MAWDVEYTDEFQTWWSDLVLAEQESIAVAVALLEQHGPQLNYPYSSSVESSRHSHMRELRVQHRGKPFRVLYAFDPRRAAILLIGGNKEGDDRWYEVYVPIADDLYDLHLISLKKEGKI